MPIRTLRITSGHREELIQLCRQYSDLQKKAVEIRCALNDKVAALAGVLESGEVAGLSIDFTQIEVVSIEEWKEALLNVTASERWVCTGFAPTEAATSCGSGRESRGQSRGVPVVRVEPSKSKTSESPRD